MGNRRQQQLQLTLQGLTTRLQRGESVKNIKLPEDAEEVQHNILHFHHS